MKYDARFMFRQSSTDIVVFPDVAVDMRHLSAQPAKFEVVFCSFRGQRISDDVGTQIQQPNREPRPFESRITSDKDRLFFKNILEYRAHYQTFQNAFFSLQSAFR